jgi:hypothetical protein
VNPDRVQQQNSLAEQLQDELLKDMLALIREGKATAADRSVIYKMLRENGWNFDPSALPADLASKLASRLSTEGSDDDDVIPLPVRRAG